MNDQGTIDATVAAVASKATGTGSAMAVFGWMTSSEIGIWAGIAIGLAGLAVNWWFRHRADKRQAAAHDAYLKRLESFSAFSQHGFSATVPAPMERIEADE